MTYARTVPSVYIVELADPTVIKIGFSSAQRWRNFLARGASLLALVEFPQSEGVAALDFEASLHAAFQDAFPRAFTSRMQANAALGLRGAGWMECYRVADQAKARALFERVAMANRGIKPYGKSMAGAIGNGMPRYGTGRDGTERESHQDPVANPSVLHAAGAVDNREGGGAMELEPWVLAEQRVWRHLNTFGGYRWPLSPREAEGPMSIEETLDEIEWLLGGGMPIAFALEQVPGRTPVSLQQAAVRRGRPMLARQIAKVADLSGAQKRKRARERNSRNSGTERNTA